MDFNEAMRQQDSRAHGESMRMDAAINARQRGLATARAEVEELTQQMFDYLTKQGSRPRALSVPGRKVLGFQTSRATDPAYFLNETGSTRIHTDGRFVRGRSYRHTAFEGHLFVDYDQAVSRRDYKNKYSVVITGYLDLSLESASGYGFEVDPVSGEAYAAKMGTDDIVSSHLTVPLAVAFADFAKLIAKHNS
ncbi:hypothetical protein [Tsukamurella sp. NPDC003166]|uniref:hypothetical protein n=1 Tax=Tsukamurella sp. NPDC003166 TaxID=3154444 RepID=UPI0033A3424A